MTKKFSFSIRPMDSGDLEKAISLSESEGWNQTIKDWRFLLENPGNKCLVAICENEIIGTATALNHAGKVAWIGMVLVSSEFRGKGIGKALMTNIIDRLGAFKTIKLDATPAGEPLYRKLGFKEEYLIYRMINSSVKDFKNVESDFRTEIIDKGGLQEIVKYDGKVFGVERNNLIRNLYKNCPSKAYLVRKNDVLDGFILGREGKKFSYIGPVSAYSEQSAKTLLLKSLEMLIDQYVAVDILSDKTEIIKWLESLGFVKQRNLLRMYLGRNSYPGQIRYQYLISGPEFG